MKTAKFVKGWTSPTGADQRLYELSEPIGRVSAGNSGSFVVVSAVDVLGTPETYIFEANSDGEITNWIELPGSFRGALDHAAALSSAGYSIADSVACQSKGCACQIDMWNVVACFDCERVYAKCPAHGGQQAARRSLKSHRGLCHPKSEAR